eukprot:CCRYP_009011-RA/>CCRYP_009011-RA protein AED:0.19 eAED:0.19 QI:157/1/1/1/1/1/4/31/693
MARRKQHKSRALNRKRRPSGKECPVSSSPTASTSNAFKTDSMKRDHESAFANDKLNDNTTPNTIRRRSALGISSSHPIPHPFPSDTAVGSSCTPLSLAVYRPASLFAMLLFAALLPKNTFSLRWLALSSCYSSHCGTWRRGGSGVERFVLEKRQVPWLGMGFKAHVILGDIEQDFDSNIFLSEEWDRLELTLAEGKFTETSRKSTVNSEILDSVPRGGDLAASGNRNGPPYLGLVNLGNTCYLNAQLQCAYHVPFLRDLILNADDETVEVEVDVEDEVENDVVDGHIAGDCGHDGQNEVIPENIAESENKNSAQTKSTTVLHGENESAVEETKPTKKTVIHKEYRPISQALRALQQTFRSLAPSGGQSYGSTQTLCRSLGINPYIQQDGQEFWKLFIPEVNYPKLTELYTGYYDDYIREIIPQNSVENEFWEEKKDDDDLIVRTEEGKPRERVRTDPFLDLSIPVTEGTGCSVEASLRETFIQPEVLRVSEGNGWRPAKDAEKVDAYKGLSLRRNGLPSLLQLHLKRFKYDWETGETSKINDCCTFPLELDLSEVMSHDSSFEGDQPTEDAIYDLQSIVVHRGEYGSGHYYSYVRPDIRTNNWYRFDDQIVTPVDYNDVIADAYGGRAIRNRATSFDGSSVNSSKKPGGIFRRIFSFSGFGREKNGGEFGYGGRTSSAYMIQYVRRSDITKLY